jgi:hypothetical protein
LILIPFVVGSLLGFTASRYMEPEPPIVHHVTTGKVGTNVDGTVWVSEYYRGHEVFNYTLPWGAIYSWFVSYADVFTVAIPSYSQGFELIRTESGNYDVYIPEHDTSVPIGSLAQYLQDPTILDRAYPMLQYAVRDIRVRAKIYEEPFGINGVITKIFDRDMSTIILGFTLKTGDELWAVVLDEDGTIILVEEIIFDVT